MSSEGRLSGGQSSAPSAGYDVASLGLTTQESSWIGLLSRPAVSLLHRILPGRLRAAALPDRAESWLPGDQEASDLLSQLDDMVSAPTLSFLGCEQGKAAGRGDPGPGGDLSWITVSPLQELGLPSGADVDLGLYQHPQLGQLSSVRAALSQVLLSSHSTRAGARKTWGSGPGGSSHVNSSNTKGWWDSLWGGDWSPEGDLESGGSWTGGAAGLCPAHTKAAGGTGSASRQPETSRAHQGPHKGPHQHPEGAPPDRGLQHGPSEVAPPTTGHDNGHSPVEEEQVQMFMVTPPGKEVPQQEVHMSASTEEMMEEQEAVEGAQSGPEEERQEEEVPIAPRCQNRAIAFIMGCPCSDDSSQSEASDHGFDSEGSSVLCDSSDDDSEAERLWSAMTRSHDPYNPRNFSARLHTSPSSSSSSPSPSFSSSSSPPCNVPVASPPSSAQSTPASSPRDRASSCLLPSGQDSWEDSTSASEADEAESLHLWSSFNCSSDPYSPLNFQAPLRTRAPPVAPLRARVWAENTSSPSSHLHPAVAPQYRKEEAEERLDSGFSETCTSSTCTSSSASRRIIKKVRFSDSVEEFFASCGEEEEEEDRRGPWEQLARDRCRFLRRCQEVEEVVASCLQPLHRQRVYQRLTAAQGQSQRSGGGTPGRSRGAADL